MENKNNNISRRDALRKSGKGLIIFGASTSVLMSSMQSCKVDTATVDWMPENMTMDQNKLISAIAEIIIPETDTPGATSAKVNRYIDGVMACYEKEEQERFLNGLQLYDQTAKEMGKDSFLKCTEDEKKSILDKHVDSEHFQLLKRGTIAGYCMSEEGATTLLEYDPVPGPYQGCIDFSEVGKTYAL